MSNSMQHWNGSQLCAIDVETTGLDPSWHEIVQICILPLDSSCQVRKDVPPFVIYIRPEFPDRIEAAALKVNGLKYEKLMEFGHPRTVAISLFEHWVESLQLPVTKFGTPKKIIPLGCNYAFDQGFIQSWLGPTAYSEYFDRRYRDVQIVASYINDKAAFHAEDVAYNKVNLEWLCSVHGVVNENPHDALHDCIATAAVYREQLRKGLFR